MTKVLPAHRTKPASAIWSWKSCRLAISVLVGGRHLLRRSRPSSNPCCSEQRQYDNSVLHDSRSVTLLLPELSVWFANQVLAHVQVNPSRNPVREGWPTNQTGANADYRCELVMGTSEACRCTIFHPPFVFVSTIVRRLSNPGLSSR